jgi:hypothetical protein
MSAHDGPNDRSRDRESNYHALVRDVILGAIAVIFVSLAVPAWILRDEYRRTYSVPVRLVPAADILRDSASVRGRMSDAAVPPPRPADILELAEQLVRREAREAERRKAERLQAERREADRREAERPEAERQAELRAPAEPAAQETAPSDVMLRGDFSEPSQAP